MPTNTPLPTVSTGNVIAAATTNDTAVLNTAVGLFGGTAAIVGTDPPFTAPNFYIQAGSFVTTTNSAGGFAFNYASAFPNGLLSVVASVGDTNISTFTSLTLIAAQCTKASIGGIAWTGGGTAVNTLAVRINFVSIGF